jgi:hypothetical protein
VKVVHLNKKKIKEEGSLMMRYYNLLLQKEMRKAIKKKQLASNKENRG